MDVANTILQLIERFGLSLTLLILGLVWLKPKVDAIWAEYSSNRSDRELTIKQKKALNVDNILQFDLKVKALLNELLKPTEVDWVQLWQFHNGIYSLGLPHIPFLYVSITHEVTSERVMPMSMIYRNLPTTFFKSSGEKFITDDIVITNLTNQSDEISKTFALGALSNVILPIRNEDGHLTALLSVGCASIRTFSEEELTAMKLTARRLGIYLATALMEATKTTEGLNTGKTPPFGIKKV